MNIYMNRVAMATFSYFDTEKILTTGEPERFYHGFVLGLMVDLADRSVLTSDRESGFGSSAYGKRDSHRRDTQLWICF